MLGPEAQEALGPARLPDSIPGIGRMFRNRMDTTAMLLLLGLTVATLVALLATSGGEGHGMEPEPRITWNMLAQGAE